MSTTYTRYSMMTARYRFWGPRWATIGYWHHTFDITTRSAIGVFIRLGNWPHTFVVYHG